MKANYKPTKFIFNKTDITLDRGQCIVGRSKLSQETGISQRSIRTAIQTLSNIGFLTSKATNRFSIITICNYESYQSNEDTDDQQTDQQVTNKRPTSDQQVTTSKELRSIKKNVNIPQDYQLVFDYFCSTLGKKLVLNQPRLKIIEQRFKEGRSVNDLKMAIDNFSRDDWEDRHKFCDIVYCLGVRSGVDNLDKWMNAVNKSIPARDPMTHEEWEKKMRGADDVVRPT